MVVTNKGNKVAKSLSFIFIVIGILIIIFMGMFFYGIYKVKHDKEELERNTMTYLLETYTNDEIKSIKVVPVTKGLGSYEARVIFKDEPTYTYYYIEKDGIIIQRNNPSVSKEEYKHLE